MVINCNKNYPFWDILTGILPNCMEHGFQFKTTDPDKLQENLSKIVGPFQARPASGSDFHASVSAKPLSNLGLFSVKTGSINVRIEPPLPFFGINLPLGKPFSIIEASRRSDFHDDVHLVAPDRTMELEAAYGCRVLAVCIDKEAVRYNSVRLTLSDSPLESVIQPRLSMATPSGYLLARGLARLWAELQAGEHAPGAHIRASEIEDEVIAIFVLAATRHSADPDSPLSQPAARSIANAEDYLCAHLAESVSRAKLAEVSGVSIRTLSRGFIRRHGMGPMQFLKARRLDAAYRDLLGSEPDVITVTEVAAQYGFTHLGKFAIDYKRAFRESPSSTLRH